MRGLRSTAVLLVVALGLGAYIYFVELDRPPGETPEPRSFAGVAYDGARNAVVLFGGSAGQTPYLGDTWLLLPDF